MYVFSGASSKPGFCFLPADKVDEHGGRRWDTVGVMPAGPAVQRWRDFQNVGSTVAGTAG